MPLLWSAKIEKSSSCIGDVYVRPTCQGTERNGRVLADDDTVVRAPWNLGIKKDDRRRLLTVVRMEMSGLFTERSRPSSEVMGISAEAALAARKGARVEKR